VVAVVKRLIVVILYAALALIIGQAVVELMKLVGL
jgi:hypothetical protein